MLRCGDLILFLEVTRTKYPKYCSFVNDALRVSGMDARAFSFVVSRYLMLEEGGYVCLTNHELVIHPETADRFEFGGDEAKSRYMALHELGHVKQVLDGRLGVTDDGKSLTWMGFLVNPNAVVSDSWYASLPWERDATRFALGHPLHREFAWRTAGKACREHFTLYYEEKEAA